MRAVTLQSVIDGVAARMGLDITVEIQANTLAAIVEYINGRLREVQEAYPWPEFTLVEQRQYRPVYAAGTTYAAGAEVLHGETYWRALQATTGNEPAEGSSYWENATLVQTIEDGGTEIGECVRVADADPRVAGVCREYDFELTADGVLVPEGPVKPWVQYCIAPVVYAVGDVAEDFPRVFAEIVKAGATADMLREDGQFEKAAAMENRFQELLDKELDKIELKQQQQRRFSAIMR